MGSWALATPIEPNKAAAVAAPRSFAFMVCSFCRRWTVSKILRSLGRTNDERATAQCRQVLERDCVSFALARLISGALAHHVWSSHAERLQSIISSIRHLGTSLKRPTSLQDKLEDSMCSRAR